MTWEDLEDSLDVEERALAPIPLDQEVCPAQEVWGRSNWSLREEHTHQAVLSEAFEQRLKSGQWPATLTPVQRWLVALRLRALRDHIEVLEAWGVGAVPTVEAALGRVAVLQWPKIRWLEHMKSAVHLPVMETDDPFEQSAPPRWLDG